MLALANGLLADGGKNVLNHRRAIGLVEDLPRPVRAEVVDRLRPVEGGGHGADGRTRQAIGATEPVRRCHAEDVLGRGVPGGLPVGAAGQPASSVMGQWDGGTMLPDRDDYDALYRDFRWRIPGRFNIGTAVSTKWAESDAERPAILSRGPDGRLVALVRGWLGEP